MKIRILLLFTLILAVFVAAIGCTGITFPMRNEELARRSRDREIQSFIEQMQKREQIQERVAGKIGYIRDPRTGLCFAYLENYVHGGRSPALATVPCDVVQKFLAPSQQFELGNK
jgi:hypothetical protein